jgi:hypothetical protein
VVVEREPREYKADIRRKAMPDTPRLDEAVELAESRALRKKKESG